jgi:hypothetical protein
MVTAKYVPDAVIRPVGPVESSAARRPLHVTFGTMTHSSFADVTPGQSLEVSEARITVRGMTEKGGVIPAGVAAGSPWQEKTFTVNVTKNPAGVLSSTVWLTGFGSVGDVRVDSLTFSDGKTWKATASESCHATTGSVLRSAR